MSENDDGGNSRSERLRQRRGARQQQSESAETDDPSEPSQSSEPDEAGDRSETANTSKLSKTDEPSKTSEADKLSKLSVKEEQVGTYMYLPQSQKKEIERLYNVLKAEYEYEFDEEFEKNRAFYPLLVQYGLESLDGLDASEIQERLESI